MKVNLIAIALVCGASLLAQAQEASQTSKPAGRAEVKAQAQAANKAGEIARGDCDVAVGVQGKSTKSRTDVSAEAKAANKAGAIDRGECAAPGAGTTKSTKSRAEVKAEAKAANKAGEIKKGDAQ